ncbi:hypothetical protein C8Q80DRAFT_571492 [Daedaleopsis nitida]|nr:hypothetical protein C8Q80DRAFT_571492 [Daedaleopsis nitida]
MGDVDGFTCPYGCRTIIPMSRRQPHRFRRETSVRFSSLIRHSNAEKRTYVQPGIDSCCAVDCLLCALYAYPEPSRVTYFDTIPGRDEHNSINDILLNRSAERCGARRLRGMPHRRVPGILRVLASGFLSPVSHWQGGSGRRTHPAMSLPLCFSSAGLLLATTCGVRVCSCCHSERLSGSREATRRLVYAALVRLRCCDGLMNL